MLTQPASQVNTCFTVGYTIGMLPQNLLLQLVPARILFPLNTVTWGGLTMVTAAAKSTSHLCVIRFFQVRPSSAALALPGERPDSQTRRASPSRPPSSVRTT